MLLKAIGFPMFFLVCGVIEIVERDECGYLWKFKYNTKMLKMHVICKKGTK